MEKRNTLQAAVSRLLKPLVRILIRYGVSYGMYAEIGKRLYVEVATEATGDPGGKVSKSRAAVMTGLSRKEIARIQALPPPTDTQVRERHNRAVRVVTEWMRNPAFTDDQGNPKPLQIENGEGSFTELVKKSGADVPVRAMLKELIRVGTVEPRGWEEVGLARPGYVPAEDEQEKFRLMGTDVGDLISTIDHNLTHTGPESRFHLKVAYDNLPQAPLAAFRGLCSKKALSLLKSLDKELSALDRDVNPASDGEGRVRAGVAIHYFEEVLPTKPSGEDS